MLRVDEDRLFARKRSMFAVASGWGSGRLVAVPGADGVEAGVQGVGAALPPSSCVVLGDEGSLCSSTAMRSRICWMAGVLLRIF